MYKILDWTPFYMLTASLEISICINLWKSFFVCLFKLNKAMPVAFFTFHLRMFPAKDERRGFSHHMLQNKDEAWLRWVVRGGSGRKVCPGSSAETQRDQLGWRGWIRPFIEPNERAPAGAWMRVGPSAPHRRVQTSDLENYPGSTSGQLSQQQDGVCMVTSRFNQCLAASHTEPNSTFALKEVCVKSDSWDIALFSYIGELPGLSCV